MEKVKTTLLAYESQSHNYRIVMSEITDNENIFDLEMELIKDGMQFDKVYYKDYPTSVDDPMGDLFELVNAYALVYGGKVTEMLEPETIENELFIYSDNKGIMMPGIWDAITEYKKH